MTKEELVEVKDSISELLEALSHYISWSASGGYESYWGSWEEYEKFNNNIVNACNIIEKEIANEKD